MEGAPAIAMAVEQERRITETLEGVRARLWNFVRKRVAQDEDAEEILQDVFYEFVQAYRLMKPIEQAGAWLFRVARNRLIDFFRKKKNDPLQSRAADSGGEEPLPLEELLPSSDPGPDTAFFRNWLLAELEHALNELPAEQREVFIAHEIEGRSYREISAATGVGVNTLLSRKRYAVMHLREHLRTIHADLSE
jgi:RNA polymerase sigma factor (sigma-70 family)